MRLCLLVIAAVAASVAVTALALAERPRKDGGPVWLSGARDEGLDPWWVEDGER